MLWRYKGKKPLLMTVVIKDWKRKRCCKVA